MYWDRFIAVVSFLAFFTISTVLSETINCYSGYRLRRYCPVNGGTANTKIERIAAEDRRYSCYKNANYAYVYLGGGKAYIRVFWGCGGKFNVINDAASWNSWGSWNSCSATCGGGRQSRRRTCSSGTNTDCTNQGSTLYQEWRNCNEKACVSVIKPTVPVPDGKMCGVESPKGSYRVINGQEANNCQYPWMVLVANTKQGTVCGGSILDETHILTAAHCVTTETALGDSYYVDDESGIRILSGSSEMPFTKSFTSIPGIYSRQVANIKVHERYDDNSLENDIAIITLEKPIHYDNCHSPICLPSTDAPQNLSGCKTMGWGVTSNSRSASTSSQLMYTDLDIVSDQSCLNTYGRYYNPRTKMCAGGNNHGSCQGDSGGPLLCKEGGRFYQYGVVSGGAKQRCGVLNSFYTRVTTYTDWIAKNTR